jgi:hypothetical protein
MKRLSILGLMLSLAMVVFAQGDVPAHFKAPPNKTDKLPPILAKEQLLGPSFRHPTQKRAYELASKIADVIYQQPCYCHCDKGFGHTSLRTCYQTDHATHCAACMQEVFYAYEMTGKGKSPTQIREGIIRGEWQKVNLDTAHSTY